MKFTTVASLLALFAAVNADCAVMGCTEAGGQGACTEFKDDGDGGCHSLDAQVFKSFKWSGDNCGGSVKYLCTWRSGACNGNKQLVSGVADHVAGDSIDTSSEGRSYKFMNSLFC